MAPGDEDWFRVGTAATGDLTVTATQVEPGDALRLELLDDNGTPLAAGTPVLDDNGQTIGQTLVYPSPFGRSYFVRLSPGHGAADVGPVRYTLSVRSLTADLGTQVHGLQPGSLAVGDEAFYPLGIAASGSLAVTLTEGANAQGTFHLEVLDAKTFAVLASGQASDCAATVNVSVVRNQAVYLHVVGDEETQGDFSLEFVDHDQFAASDSSMLFFPLATGPSESALADLNGDGALDIVVTHVGVDMISVLVNNGDGTYEAPMNFAVGAFQPGGPFTLQQLTTFHRDLAIADFNADGRLDVAVVNTSSGDISVLLGNGDGTFQPQRRFDATSAPFALAAGDLNNDGIPDLAVVDSTAGAAQGGILIGRGNGTFKILTPIPLTREEPYRTNSIRIADLDHDGNNDLLVRDFSDGTTVLLGNGDGTFRLQDVPALPANGPGIDVADLDGDGKLDVVATKNNTSEIDYALANGDGTFQADTTASVGQFPVAVAVADFASVDADGGLIVGVPDGRPDLIVANNGRTIPLFSGPAEIVVMAGLVDGDGNFDGFSDPVRLASASGPLDVHVRDVNNDGVLDVVVVDREGVLVTFGKLPTLQQNDSRDSARDLGTAVHLVLPTLTITPDHPDAWYRLQVPTEVVPGSRDQVIDFSSGFEHIAGAGLLMEVYDAAGGLRGAGERLRIVARQGETLFVHVSSRRVPGAEPGTGAYTLVIDTLPQVVNVEAQSLLPGQDGQPGGPTTALVLVFQGDHLDSSTAEDPANYSVTWLGADGIRGTADDREVPVGAGISAGALAVVYDPIGNVDVSSGLTHPTASRQTVTLLFGQPLPAGSYEVDVSANVVAAPFNVDELSLLSPSSGIHGHPVASAGSGVIHEGALLNGELLVHSVTTLGDLSIFEAGTRFLTQFHNDLARFWTSGSVHTAMRPRLHVNCSTTLSRDLTRRWAPWPTGWFPWRFCFSTRYRLA